MLSRAFTRREKTLLIILAFLLVFAFYYLIIEVRVGDAVEAYRQEIELSDQKLVAYRARIARMNAMKAELEEIRKQTDPVIVPDFDNLESVMDFLGVTLSVTKDYAISFAEVQLPAEGEYIVCRNAQISFEAENYTTAKSVIRKLQDSPYCCTLADVSIAPEVQGRYIPRDSVQENSVRATVSVTFYEAER